ERDEFLNATRQSCLIKQCQRPQWPLHRFPLRRIVGSFAAENRLASNSVGSVTMLKQADATRIHAITAGTGAMRRQLPHWIDHLPPCNGACPAGENIQGWLEHARAGQWQQAWKQILDDNPFPAVHGRACYHPCQSKCNRGELDSAVGIHAVERLVGDVARKEKWQATCGEPTGR